MMIVRFLLVLEFYNFGSVGIGLGLLKGGGPLDLVDIYICVCVKSAMIRRS